MKSSAEIVIIGAGISGLATAYNLAVRGMKDIVVIEKGYITSGSTGRCGAGVRQQWGTEMNCRLSKASCEILENLEEILDYKRSIEFKQGGYLLFATTEKEVEQFEKNVTLQNSLGINSSMLSIDEALEIVPDMNTEGVMAFAFHQKDGHANPFHTTFAYAEAARRLGVEINTYTTVTGIKVENGRIESVITDKGEIKTHRILNAAGGFAKDIGRMVGVELPLKPERHEILVTEPVEPILGPMLMSFSWNFYIQQEPNGTFIMGYGEPNNPESQKIDSSWHFAQEMARKAIGVYPPLSRVRVVRQWAGLYMMTPDSQPIYGSIPGVDGFYIAAGFSGHGFMFGPITGVLMAEYILGEEPEIPINMLDVGRFERGELIYEPSVV
ncbi:MAG: FAD-binding oxidoreductase [Thermoanaerobacteraceae bacterium]|nr:FAD-binding oxidoreductase [Thermoanaerobacteraceae bacterium]